jgi:hypothetical protein
MFGVVALGAALLTTVPARAYDDHFLLNCTTRIGDEDVNESYDLNVGAQTVTTKGSGTLALKVTPTQYSWELRPIVLDNRPSVKYKDTVDRVTGVMTFTVEDIEPTGNSTYTTYTGSCRRVALGARQF